MDATTGVGHEAEPDPYAVAREIALRALDRRAYGCAELGNYLRRKGASEDVTQRVLDRFIEVGLLDDVAFASQWVESRHRQRKLPRRALAMELRRKGIEEDVIAETVAPIDQEAEARTALELALSKASSMQGRSYDVALRRLIGVLGRRGFSSEVAWAAARSALAQDRSGGPEAAT